MNCIKIYVLIKCNHTKYGHNFNNQSCVPDLQSYFSLVRSGSSVQVTLQRAIPEESIPSNRLILLELRASAPQTVPAFATIAITVARNDDTPVVDTLAFAKTYYTGQYTLEDGLTFQEVISVVSGYDDSVEVTLEGGECFETIIWF